MYEFFVLLLKGKTFIDGSFEEILLISNDLIEEG
jgi:hypothetical protein